MAAKAGVGFSEKTYSRDAGIEAARVALAQAGAEGCDLVLLFATAKHDPKLLRDGVRDVVGPQARIIGGASVGVITNDRMGYEGHQAGAAVISSDAMTIDLFKERGLADNEYGVGSALGQQIRSKTYEGQENLLLMYDLVKSRTSEAMSLNITSPLLRGMEQSLGDWPATAGLGLLGSFQFNPGFHWFDDEVEGQQLEEQSALALMLSGDVRMDTVIMHGCCPSSGYHTITKADESVILEIDGRSAADTVRGLMGVDQDVGWEDFPIFTVFGINKGDKFGAFKKDDYTVRMCQAVDRERGGLAVVADDLKTGTEFQFMRRSIDFDYMGEQVRALRDRLNGSRPFFAFYINCAARAGAFSGMDEEDAEEMQRVIGDEIPLLGMYSGVEIAKVGSDIVQNNMTGVLCLFSETS